MSLTVGIRAIDSIERTQHLFALSTAAGPSVIVPEVAALRILSTEKARDHARQFDSRYTIQIHIMRP